MDDVMVSLAHSVQNNKGVFALLLGSGVSRAADIPTGWEVTIDLVRQVAAANGEDCDSEPEEWYSRTFGSSPDYSKLLEQLGGTPNERRSIMAKYFEPTDDEREQGKKLPTRAHKAVAELVAKGFIRVIVTTNFDRLLEQALEAEGIVPIVIRTSDDIKGAPPLAHSSCTIVKIHGDYMDARIKNTADELAGYDSGANRLLDQIMDEYGLIVCGWSADYDPALCKAILRAPSRRYSTFWAYRGRLGDSAQHIIHHRNAKQLEIRDSDTFFDDLLNKVVALEESGTTHPISRAMAVSALKRYLEQGQKIRLHDLMMQEIESLYKATHRDEFSVRQGDISKEARLNRVAKYEALSETSILIIANLCYWGGEEHEKLWVRAIERLADVELSGITFWMQLARYPSSLLFYAAGIAATASGRNNVLTSLFMKPQLETEYGNYEAAAILYPLALITDTGTQREMFGNLYVPMSDHLFRVLRPLFQELVPSDREYENAFNRFEYLLALTVGHYLDKHDRTSNLWAPPGKFGWATERMVTNAIMPSVRKEIATQGTEWFLVKAGLFDGDINRVNAIADALAKRINGMH